MTQIFEFEQDEGFVLVTPVREISELADIGVDEAVQDVLANFAKSSSTHLLLDFKFVNWLGSAMLEILVTFWKDTQAVGGQLAICNLSEVGLEALKLTRLNTLGRVYATRQEAVEDFRA